MIDRKNRDFGIIIGIIVLVFFACGLSIAIHEFTAGDWNATTVEYGASSKPSDEVDEEADSHAPLFGEAARSGHWPTVMHHFLHNEYESKPGAGDWKTFNDGIDRSRCRCCGASDNLNVHHIDPFHDDPTLELNPTNLVTLCREHHFKVGHYDREKKSSNWKSANPNVCADCDKMRAKLNPNR